MRFRCRCASRVAHQDLSDAVVVGRGEDLGEDVGQVERSPDVLDVDEAAADVFAKKREADRHVATVAVHQVRSSVLHGRRVVDAE